MQKRNYTIWGGAFLITLCLAIFFVLFPPILALSPYAGDILGSMIGFMLAISFAEIVKLDEKRDRVNKLEVDIEQEIKDIGKSIESIRVSVFISMDIWELAISTGDLALLDTKQRSQYSSFYNGVRTYNWAQDSMLKWLTSPNPKPEVIEEIEKIIDGIKVVLLAGAKAFTNKQCKTKFARKLWDRFTKRK